MLSQLSGLAALAGVRVGEVSATEIYQNLVLSESVIGPVIYSKYLTKEYPDSVNLIQYFEVKKEDPNPEIQKRKRFLAVLIPFTKGNILTDIDRVTKILTVKVTMPEAQLSADIVNKLVESLDFYIRTKRKSYAGEQRYYLEKRVEQIKDSLSICENKLRDFREQNRMVIQSPNLLLEQERLLRNIQIQQNVYIELTKQLELAKIDEIRDTPILNIKEIAQNPIIKTGPKRVLIVIFIMFFSFLATGSYYLFEDIIKKTYKYVKPKK
jgi:capsule polysaccharide export protein KpsE/RkpR